MENTNNLKTEYLPSPLPLGRSRAADGTQYAGEAAVDIIAVQGLGSSYEWTWSAEIPGSEQRYHWLRSSICKDIPHARVLAFEYDSKWIGDIDSVSLQECGSRLLRAVIADRCHAGDSRMCPTRSRRPIMFIGHSFGGLVIKQSIVLASQTGPDDPLYDDHQAFLLAVTSIFFLGTPHQGSSFPDLAKFKIYSARLFGAQTDERLLRILRLKSDLLIYLQAEFDNVQKRHKKWPISLYCYSEQRPVKLGPFSFGFVVSESSAFLNGATNQSMAANHMGLNKFAPEDQNYDVTLKPDLLQGYREAARTSHSRFASRQYGTDQANPELQNLNQLLRPITASQKIQRDFKYHEQQRIVASPPTCSWIENLDIFQDWKSAQEFKCLWIYGKPGSGKSVLSSYVSKLLQPGDAEQSRESQQCNQPLVGVKCDLCNMTAPAVAYFMCGVDAALESPSVILGTLLHQVLLWHDMNHRLQGIALSAMRKLKAGPNPRELANLLVELLNAVGRVYIIVDGLEENNAYIEVIETLAILSSSPSICLLILSRKLHDLEQNLRRSFSNMLEFDITAHSKADIEKVAEVRTEELILTRPDLAMQRLRIEHYLKENADGVFLWLNAAHKYLDNACTNPDDVERSLHGLHPDIDQMYQAIFNSLYQRKTLAYERKRIQAVLMWLCAGAISMSTSEIWTLSRLEDEYDAVTLGRIESTPISDSHAAKELKALMESAIDIVDDGTGRVRVQLHHRTLEEYLTREDRSSQDWPFFTVSKAHTYCALISMSICRVSCIRLTRRSRLTGQPGILDYAWQFWHYHFQKSGQDLSGSVIAESFDRMLASIFRDSLSVLEGYAEFLSQQFDISHIKGDNRLSFVRSFQDAQQALALSLSGLAVICRRLPVSKELQGLRRVLDEEAETARRGVGTSASNNPALKKIVALTTKLKKRPLLVQKLQIDELLPPALIRPETLVNMLIDFTRAMRIVAVTTAIDPVYREMMNLSTNMDFTPVTFLVHVCNMFEAIVSFPYWNQQPPSVDPIRAYNILGDDRYRKYGAVVRHRFSVTERWKIGDSLLEKPPLWYKMIGPRLELSAVQWNTALLGYRLFYHNGNNPLVQTFVLNPVAQTHARHFMYARNVRGAGFLSDPATTLLQNIPQELQDAPFRSILSSIPSLLWLLLAKYVELLTRPFGRFSWPWLQSQWGRIKLARVHLGTFMTCVERTNHPESTISYIHWFFGLILYFVRRKYFLFIGAHSSPYPIDDITNALTLPAKYVENLLVRDWIWWAKYNITLLGGNFFFGACAFQTRRPANDYIAFLPTVVVIFWMFCALERAFCAVVNTAVTPLFFISLVFQDAEALKDIFKVSAQYWLRALLGLLSWVSTLGLLPRLGGWAVLAGVCSYVALLLFIVVYEDVFWASVWQLIYPIRMSVWIVIRGVVLTWLPVLRMIGITTTFVVVVAGTAAFSSFATDPLGLQDTRWRIKRAIRQAQKVPGDRERFQIREKHPQSAAVRSPEKSSQVVESSTLNQKPRIPQQNQPKDVPAGTEDPGLVHHETVTTQSSKSIGPASTSARYRRPFLTNDE